MAKKRYEIKSSCPQCGCTHLTVMSEEEIRAKYGDNPNALLECSECMLKYQAEMAKVCPEWDKDCKMRQS